MYSFSREDIVSFGKNREWLSVNGKGGFAFQTLLGSNTRKYHGLLVSTANKGKSFLSLSNFDESIEIEGKTFNLSTHHFENASTQGFQFLDRVEISTFPVFIFDVKGVIIRKTILMQRNSNTVIVNYKIFSKKPFVFRAKPLVNMRPAGETNSNLNFQMENFKSGVRLERKGELNLKLVSSAQFKFDPVPWNDFFFEEEQKRGYAAKENCLCIGTFSSKESSLTVYATNEDNGFLQDFEIARKEEERRADQLIAGAERSEKMPAFGRQFYDELLTACDKFVVSPGAEEVKIFAGFPWFANQWGRDALISMPGILLCSHRFEDAKKFLKGVAKECTRGEIPNFTNGEKNFNSIDASLWFFVAAYKFYQYTGDAKFVERELWPAMKDILKNYEKKEHAIGLLENGDAMTWMDAMSGGKAITPRRIAIEINALYYNALKISDFFAQQFFEVEVSKRFGKKADGLKKKIEEFLWNRPGNYFNDCLSDDSIRPNQIIAISLPFPVCSPEKERQVLEVVERRLLTSRGLKTLGEESPKFRGEYFGSQLERDLAYHNGTIWPFLLGFFVSAKMRLEGEKAKEICEVLLRQFFAELSVSGVGGICEVYSANSKSPNGCPFQAWSAAEIMRAYYEDILQMRPLVSQADF